MIQIKPYDNALDNRLRVIGFNKKYVDEPSNEFELKIDYNIENEIKTEKFRRCFIMMLIEAYTNMINNGLPDEPEEVMEFKRDWVDDDGDIISKFINDFEITNNQDNYIPSKDIEYWITENKLGISMKKFGVDMKKYCAKNKLDNVYSKDKKINGKSVMAWFGVKKIEEEEEMVEVGY
jgi:hypothetical protein